MNLGTEIVSLPAGRRRDGEWQREVEIRPVTGCDELALMERFRDAVPARRVTELLARCSISFGSLTAAREAVRELTVGDREALALRLHALTFGSSVPCLTDCPGEACGERLEVELTTASLLQPQYGAVQDWYEADLDDGRRLRFRLPTGGDQESAAGLAGGLVAAERRLWSLCVEGIPDEARDEASDRLVSDLMERRDPQADLVLEMACPQCGQEFRSLFDAGGYLVAELEHRRPVLVRQVHLLAFHYRWAEAEILALTPPRRLSYVRAIEDELAAAVGS